MNAKPATNGSSAAVIEVQPDSVCGEVALNVVVAERDGTISFPGQQNIGLVELNPNSKLPPPTDHGTLESIWHSFDLTHRRVQAGGWTHQVTEREMRMSTEIAGVDMRINKGGFREAHWHLADEWAIVLKGTARVTVFSPDGTMFIDDVSEGDLWIFPAGSPHSIQGTGDSGVEFLLVFNQGSFSEESTFLLSDWLMHTPPDVLAKNFGLGPDSIAKLPKNTPLYIFASEPPTQTLAEDQAEIAKRFPMSQKKFTFKRKDVTPTQSNGHGHVLVVDQRNFPASQKICSAICTIKPGGMRELHWHPNASEWQFWIQGKGRMTVFNSSEDARTMDFNANDVGFVPKMAGHYVENLGDENLIFLEMFATPDFQEIALNQWLRAMPAQVTMAHTNLSAEEVDKIAIPLENFV